MRKYLIIAAHPDDEVLGAGGSIARWRKKGWEVKIAILGEGITSRSEKKVNIRELKTLKQQALKAAKILSADNPLFFDFPDNRFDSLDIIDIVKPIEKMINSYRPDVVVSHFIGDLNIDHRITAEAVSVATRPTGSYTPEKVLSFNIPSSTEWNFYDSHNTFNPNIFINISKTLKIKLKALEAYEGELRSFPHPRSLESLKARAVYWGSISGLPAAEPFILLREINFEG